MMNTPRARSIHDRIPKDRSALITSAGTRLAKEHLGEDSHRGRIGTALEPVSDQFLSSRISVYNSEKINTLNVSKFKKKKEIIYNSRAGKIIG